MSNLDQQERVAQLDSEGMDRGISFLGLTWASEASLIGSGWLFGALTAVTIAGPSAIIAWIIATIIVAVLALIHAELGGLFPVSGGTSRFPHYAFGSFAGATFGWMSYLQAAAVAPIEVLAAIEYLSSVHAFRHWYNGDEADRGRDRRRVDPDGAVHVRQSHRRSLAGAREQLADVVEGLGSGADDHRLLSSSSTGRTSALPAASSSTAPRSRAILIAIPTGGIVFSLLGFEQAVQLGGEARNPSDVPKAVIISLIIGATIYILLQVAFIGAIQPSLLAHAGTWANLGPTSSNATVAALNKAPFHEVASARRTRLAGRDPANRRGSLAKRHRTDLPHVGLADPVRAVEERLHPARPSRTSRAATGCRWPRSS